MDCRRAVLLSLAFISLCAGCKALRGADPAAPRWSLLPRKSTTMVAKSTPQLPSLDEKAPEDEVSLMSWSSKKEPRKPKASTSIAWAVFREKTARLAETEAERQKLLDDARVGYQTALETDPKNVQAVIGLARIYTEMAKDDRALEIYAKALKEHPQEATLWFSLGEHYKSRKDWMEAAKSYYQAHKFDPENRRYMQWLGFCLATAGQSDEAFVWLSKANGDATAHYNLAQFHMQQKNDELCRKHLQAAIDKNPQHIEAKELLARLSQANAAELANATPPAPVTVNNAAPTAPATSAPAPRSPLHDLPPTASTTPPLSPRNADLPPVSALPPTTSSPPPTQSSIMQPPPVAQIGFLPDAVPQASDSERK